MGRNRAPPSSGTPSRSSRRAPSSLLSTPARAQTPVVGIESTANIQIWQLNMHNLFSDWDDFIDRMAAWPVRPDIIVVQELCNCDVGGGPGNDFTTFHDALSARFGSYGKAHGATTAGSGQNVSTQAVFWRTSRFTIGGSTRWNTKVGSTCSTDQQLNVAVVEFPRFRGHS